MTELSDAALVAEYEALLAEWATQPDGGPPTVRVPQAGLARLVRLARQALTQADPHE